MIFFFFKQKRHQDTNYENFTFFNQLGKQLGEEMVWGRSAQDTGERLGVKNRCETTCVKRPGAKRLGGETSSYQPVYLITLPYL